MRALIFVCAAALVGACSKQEPPKTADQVKAEQDAATKRTRENPVYGDPLRSLDKAKSVQDTLNKQAEETAKKAE